MVEDQPSIDINASKMDSNAIFSPWAVPPMKPWKPGWRPLRMFEEIRRHEGTGHDAVIRVLSISSPSHKFSEANYGTLLRLNGIKGFHVHFARDPGSVTWRDWDYVVGHGREPPRTLFKHFMTLKAEDVQRVDLFINRRREL